MKKYFCILLIVFNNCDAMQAGRTHRYHRSSNTASRVYNKSIETNHNKLNGQEKEALVGYVAVPIATFVVAATALHVMAIARPDK